MVAVSVEHLAAVLHHSRAKGTAKLVLVGVANHQGDGGSYPAITTLARYANVDPRNVQRAIEKLTAMGELRVDVQAGGGSDTPDHERTNRYYVLVTCPPWCDRSTQHRDTRERKHLWIKGVAPAPGGGASARGGVAPASPGGVAPAPPKPPTKPDHPQVETQGTDRARELDPRPCHVCDQSEAKCISVQAAYPLTDRHTYRARRHAEG